MLLKTSLNRKVIIDYLNNVSEDSLINEIIIPFYNFLGYSVVDISMHGPGEHGKDIIFKRFKPAINSEEFIFVQAKAQKVTISNINSFSDQLKRAFLVEAKDISNGNCIYPNYVIFFNSKTMTNDAKFEFPSLKERSKQIQIFTQVDVCELIFNYLIIPDSIKNDLYLSDDKKSSDLNDMIHKTIYSNNASEVKLLYENILPLHLNSPKITNESKNLIIEYIFKLWNEDRSWPGTVKPMKWLDLLFNFIQKSQYPKLSNVVSEFYNSTPSFDARNNVSSIIDKITGDQIISFEKKFVMKIAEKYFLPSTCDNLIMQTLVKNYYDYIKNKNLDIKENEYREKLCKNIEIAKKLVKLDDIFDDISDDIDDSNYKELEREYKNNFKSIFQW